MNCSELNSPLVLGGIPFRAIPRKYPYPLCKSIFLPLNPSFCPHEFFVWFHMSTNWNFSRFKACCPPKKRSQNKDFFQRTVCLSMIRCLSPNQITMIPIMWIQGRPTKQPGRIGPSYGSTLWQTNIAPARKPSQKETSLPIIHLKVLCKFTRG